MNRLQVVAATVLLAACSSGGGSVTTSSTTTRATETTAGAATTTTGEEIAMQLTSRAFEDAGVIPVRYTCDGDDVSPPLDISGVPVEAAVLALVMDDPDAPRGTWDHWIVFDMPVVDSIPEDVGSIGVAGRNSWDRVGYGGPCPPSGTHRYVFRLFALSAPLGLAEGATKADVLTAVEDSTLATATLTGTYSR